MRDTCNGSLYRRNIELGNFEMDNEIFVTFNLVILKIYFSFGFAVLDIFQVLVGSQFHVCNPSAYALSCSTLRGFCGHLGFHGNHRVD